MKGLRARRCSASSAEEEQLQVGQELRVSDGRWLRITNDELVVLPPTHRTIQERVVVLQRQKVIGLGLSVKGGAEHRLPLFISRIVPNGPAHLSGKLFVGDALIKVNDGEVDHLKHDDAVNLLHSSKEDVALTVRHLPFIGNFLASIGSAHHHQAHECEIYENYPGLSSDVIVIPLLMAHLTTYYDTETDSNISFEVRSYDGQTSAVIHCDEVDTLEKCMEIIANNIKEKNTQQLKMFNQCYLSSELVSYMTWVEEAQLLSCQPWRPRFLVLKGQDVLLFETPPLTSKEVMKGGIAYKIHQSMFKLTKDAEEGLGKSHCFVMETTDEETGHHFAVESAAALQRLHVAWQRATYTAVTRLGSQTFSALSCGRAVALTLDWTSGFSLYDVGNKLYLWNYRFSQLKGSCDDGKCRLKLHFHNEDSKIVETKELECPHLRSLLFCIHSFLTAKIVSVDPDFIRNNS